MSENKPGENKPEVKTKLQQITDTVTNVVKVSSEMGIVHRIADHDDFDGRYVSIGGQKLLFFGSCGYLSLEKHPAIIQAGVEALMRHGSQFSSSRAYVSSKYYEEAEALLSQMYGGKKVLLFQSLTLGHISNLPLLVDDNDAVIIDERAHDSIQSAVMMLKLRQIKTEVIRHNRMDRLEDQIKILKNTYKKIWYLADGMYSMHGDFAPVKELWRLADQYEQLHLYMDDIHGMSWTGPYGTGMVMDKAPFYHHKLYFTTGLTKAFGTMGGVLVYPDDDSYMRVKSCGKGFIFSIQMPPSAVASTVAACKIHLSDEITGLQVSVKQKIDYFNKRAIELGLLLMHIEQSPVFFIGVGEVNVGYDMVLRLKKAGFFINIAVFPAVPFNKTGLRITIANALSIADIEELLLTIAENLPDCLQKHGSSFEKIKKIFRQKE